MQIVSDAYKAYMSQPVRPPFHMEITVHTDTPIVYTDNEIFEFEEKKTAHPIGAELPTIEVSFKVDNIAGDYNADSPSGLYEQLIKGVKVTYKYGLEIPNVMPYGYPADEGETEEPIYGADPLNPYGFSPSSTIEWMDGGEVYTTGEISYDKTSATIEAVDALSFLEETADVAYGTINRKQCAQFIIDATEYPEDLLGAKKISIDALLETWNTNVVSDKNAKQVLQSLAHASGVQIYIDRSGYLHLDKIPITTGAVDYHVTLGDQDEDGEFTKGKTARKVVVKVNTKNVVPEVSETINPRGEDIFVENDFVQTTLQAEVVLPWVKRYLAMRNTAEIEYAGDPALDILDIVLLDTEYSENIPATIVESTIRFDGSITGSLVLRYDSALADNTTVKITGAENFIYSGETPSPASVTLVCETDITTPSYEWSYFNDSSSGWQVISGATTANLTILADSAYIVGSNPTSFRVVVTGDEGTKGTTVRIQRVQEAVAQGHTYLGKLTALPSAYDVGDYFLVSTAFSTYGLGDVVQWDGDSWEVTTNPTLIVSVYQDALTLSMPLENTSAVNQYIRSIQTKQILLSTDTPIMFFYEDDTPYDGGQVATITATRRNVISGINWYINGELVPDYDEDTIMVYDTDMSGNEITVTAVSVEYASVNAVIKIAKKKDRKLDASNLGLITNGDPTPTVGKDGAPLVAGDYFMWGNPTTSTPDVRKKGAVYIYQTNGTWLEDTEGTKTMSMFAQFAELPNDTDSSVMGNAIIKNLVAIKAFIENLEAQNMTAGTGNGTTGGFRFRAKSRTDISLPYDATTNPSVFDVMYDDRKVFEVDPENGNIMFGNYSPSTKSGGILYDYVNDKLLGNVAYDQWDLVIESDADLALLTTGSTTYTKVLIAPGVYNATAPIDLDAHGVVTFVGVDRDNSVLNVGFCVSHTGVKGYFLKIGQNTKEMGNFTIASDTTQYDTTVNVNNDIYIIYCPLYGTYPATNIHDITVDSAMFAYENTSGTPTPWTRTFGMLGPNAGSSASQGQIIGFNGSITNCYFANLWFGIQYFSNISGCKFSSIANNITECVSITSCIITGSSITQNGISNSWSVTGCTVYDANNRGFSSCFSVAGCRAISSLLTGNGFYLCWEISGCYVAGHQYGFHMCERVSACRCYYSATYDFTYCNYVSSSFSASSPPKWSNCTKVDSDSCNN